MNEKIVLITGGNSGIGKETALALAEKGATIVITARDEAKGQAAIKDIHEKTNGPLAELFLLDLKSFASIRRMVCEFRQKFERLDVLINNAGILTTQLNYTEEGFELQFGVNYLGPFLLTHLLQPALAAAPKPRLVNVSSRGHVMGRIDFDSFRGASGRYCMLRAYAQSKLAVILFTREWSRQYPKICANSLHPGGVRTGIGHKNSRFLSLFWSLISPALITPKRGAATSIYLASSAKVEGVAGRYFDQHQRECRPSRHALDDNLARRLWDVSIELTNPQR